MRALLVALALLLAQTATAHVVGLSKGEYRATGATVEAELVFARPELANAVPGLDADHDHTISAQELAANRDTLDAALRNGVDVRAGAAACPSALEDAHLTEQDGLAVSMRFRCERAADAYAVRLVLLSALSLGHRHLVTLGNGETRVLFESQPDFQLAAAADAHAGIAAPLFALGVEHILTGYDHLLFLLGLILIGGRFRALLLVITAFTIAHSITLGLAAFGVVAPSPALIEPAIALSIAYVGIENLFVKDASRRWMLTFAFGLIHGFGFAGALQEVALSRAQIPLALVSFNAGVEAGQLVVLAAVLPLLAWLRRHDWFRAQGVRFASLAITAAGLVWFAQRV
jgi:hypothetical protein